MAKRLEWPAKRRKLVSGFTVGEWVAMIAVGQIIALIVAWAVSR